MYSEDVEWGLGEFKIHSEGVGCNLGRFGCPEDGGGSGRSSQVMSSQAGVKD